MTSGSRPVNPEAASHAGVHESLPKSVHFVGIGGIGMIALAQYLWARGVTVSGSDSTDTAALDAVRFRDITILSGHSAEHVGAVDMVVMTAAAPASNPEVVEAQRRGIPVLKRAQLLGRLVNEGQAIAVAGTHGKTTTSALTAHLLRAAGMDLTLLGGGFVRAPSGGLEGPSWGASPTTFVVEADEYDRSFHELLPTWAVITGIEFDHPDCYEDLHEMIDAYEQFTRQVTRGLIISGRAATALRVAATSGLTQETYGAGEGYDWEAVDVQRSWNGARFGVRRHGAVVGDVELRIPGIHNVENALAALAAASSFSGRPPEALIPGFMDFQGVARRLEPKGTVDGVRVIDDYAHHPSEIRAAITALRDPSVRLRLIFQPHTFSRTDSLFDDFVDALGEADEILLLDVYAAREAPLEGADSQKLAAALRTRGKQALHFPDRNEAAKWAVRTSSDGDVVVTMGAGDVGDLAGPIVGLLENRRPRRSSRGATLTAGSASGRAEAIAAELREAGLQRVRINEPMDRHTSWRIGGPADFFAVAQAPSGLAAALDIAHRHGSPCLVLGGGSNILVADGGVEGVVVLSRLRSLAEIESADIPLIEAGSGVFFAKLASFAASHRWAGLEWGVAIPGTVGAGIVNNAGAHHGDVQRTLDKAEAVNALGEVMVLTPQELSFQYRQSILKEPRAPVTETRLAITRAWFRVERDTEGRSQRLIDELMTRRRETQPISQPSAGSTFTNPPGGSAGELIEQAGLKGFQVGGAEVSSKHANFIINRGDATAADVVDLVRHIRREVESRFGVVLRPEVQLVGRWAVADPFGQPEAVTECA